MEDSKKKVEIIKIEMEKLIRTFDPVKLKKKEEDFGKELALKIKFFKSDIDSKHFKDIQDYISNSLKSRSLFAAESEFRKQFEERKWKT